MRAERYMDLQYKTDKTFNDDAHKLAERWWRAGRTEAEMGRLMGWDGCQREKMMHEYTGMMIRVFGWEH